MGWFSTTCVTNRFDEVMAFPLGEYTRCTLEMGFYFKGLR
ncbi:hypothetical protein BFV94_2933 [Alteromonas macleodii]|uniref:Coenzyme PQQ synthesis protein A n=1 Tax=Alteromonas macleodii TaxID=28108 RepID=A0AB36FPX7_ALTMA|nr:hypothetical protein BFV93_2922 [Alteromonas macleodii]OES30145.1 hypothetical protein BFV94_2933 [Alteromonas macleodii]OES30278.1 hypothetical protein BFV95_2933 [Alteromonas macleodii]OES40535.1 hypothetical protein BFV96_2917 [Alteromonas macleodii]